MRFLVDTNILVAASVKEVSYHLDAVTFIKKILTIQKPWCLSWINIYEFLRVVTHAKVLPKPISFDAALKQLELLITHPTCEILKETNRHPSVLKQVTAQAGIISGNFVHDCHIATLMREHDVGTIVTNDTHFRRFGNWINVVLAEDSADLLE
jgi:toxin-antitoxin system PIN domain toxin